MEMGWIRICQKEVATSLVGENVKDKPARVRIRRCVSLFYVYTKLELDRPIRLSFN